MNTTTPFVQGSIPSLEAALSIAPDVSTLEGRVYAVLAVVGAAGATDEELATLYTFVHSGDRRKDSTLRARRVKLVDKGLVRDSGLTRPGVSGRQMTVWVVGA